MSILRTAIVGCGNIATRYAEQISGYAGLEIAGFSDLMQERAVEFAENYGGQAYASFDDVLADDSVDLVVNLTIHHAHYEVVKSALEAGKHVHSEKPLALTTGDASELVALAEKKGLRLSSAPITYMGEAAQTALKVIREGKVGTIRLVYAEVNHGRIETWHPNPEPFYDVGPLWDVGVYPLTMMTAFLGSIRRVSGFGKVIYPDRVTKEGRAFTIKTPDLVIAVLEFESGVIGRITANFYAKGAKGGGSLEFHGDTGRLFLGNFQQFQAPVEFGLFGEEYEPVPHVREPFEGTEFGRGVEDLANAIAEGRPHRASGAHAAHVVEVIGAINRSAETGQTQSVESSFVQPEPMPWAT